MKTISAIICIMFLVGCATVPSKQVCRHEAAASCFAAHEDGKNSFIAFGPVDGKINSWHAQAFILVDGKRVWLNSHAKPTNIQDAFTPQKIYSYREYLNYLLSR